MQANRLTLKDLKSELWRCAEIERANPDTLMRVFGAADWGNREMLGDELLKDLIEGLSGVPLDNTAVGSDILGDAYEYLIGKFADITRRKKAGEFYTPRSVVRMMVELLDPQEGESIYDPACGTGGMLLGAIEHVERAGGDPRTFFGRIFGEEKNLTTSSIARMNLVLHGVENFRIERSDTLRDPAFTDTSGALATFDCVIANPPFSLKEWGRDVWEADPWGRAAFGLPPASYGDYAWVQQMVASMAEGSGRMAVVLPQGALFRKGAEGRIRRALLEQDLIEAVIGLAPNVFYGTGLAPAVVTLRCAKRRGRQRKVMVVDAGTSASMKKINADAIRQLSIVLPSSDTQDAMLRQVGDMMVAGASAERRLRALKRLRSTVLSSAL